MPNNPIGDAAAWWKKYGPNPLLTSLLIGGGIYGLGRLAWNPLVDTYGALAGSLKRKMGASPDEMREFAQDLEETKKDAPSRHRIPAIIGAALGGLSLYLMSDKERRYNGVFSWSAPKKVLPPDKGPVRKLVTSNNTLPDPNNPATVIYPEELQDHLFISSSFC